MELARNLLDQVSRLLQHITPKLTEPLLPSLPAGAIAIAGLIFFLHVPPPADTKFSQMIRRVDFGGAILCVAGVTLFLLGLTWATTSGWGSAQCLAPLIIGVAVMVAFVFYEWKVPQEPNVPLRLFSNRNFSITVIVMFIIGFSMNGASFFMPQFFQFVLNNTATTAGLRVIPWIGPFMWVKRLVAASPSYELCHFFRPISMMCGIISSRKGIYVGSTSPLPISVPVPTFASKQVPFPKVGMALAAVGLGLASTWNVNTPYATQAGEMVLLGIGFGASLSIIMLAVQANCEMRDIGPGTSVGTFMRCV